MDQRAHKRLLVVGVQTVSHTRTLLSSLIGRTLLSLVFEREEAVSIRAEVLSGRRGHAFKASHKVA